MSKSAEVHLLCENGEDLVDTNAVAAAIAVVAAAGEIGGAAIRLFVQRQRERSAGRI